MSAVEGNYCSALLLRSFLPEKINFCGDSYGARLIRFCSGSGSDDKQWIPYLCWGSNSGPPTRMIFAVLLLCIHISNTIIKVLFDRLINEFCFKFEAQLKLTNLSAFWYSVCVCVCVCVYDIYIYIYIHIGCPGRNVPDFGRMFLNLLAPEFGI